MTDPVADAEWQDAVDVAHAMMVLDSARQYGLVTGGPMVDLDRCVDIVTRGKARGVAPRPDAIEKVLHAFHHEARP